MFTFLSDDGVEKDSLTYQQMVDQTAGLAAYLLDGKNGLNLKKGDRVLLVFEPSLLYIMSFLACVRAGVIAVPVFPPGGCQPPLTVPPPLPSHLRVAKRPPPPPSLCAVSHPQTPESSRRTCTCSSRLPRTPERLSR